MLSKNRIPAHTIGLDLDYWRKPEGAAVPDDELRFLLVPGAVVDTVCFELAKQVHAYQRDSGSDGRITRALVVARGGQLPGLLLRDHLVEGRPADAPCMEFGVIDLTRYLGPGEIRQTPLVRGDLSLSVEGHNVLVIDDLGDEGGTLQFLSRHLRAHGAGKVLRAVMYMKPAALHADVGGADFYFGEVPQHTWIITPRERVETLMKRVPVWKARGASMAECRRRLVDIIGYPADVADYYLPAAYA